LSQTKFWIKSRRTAQFPVVPHSVLFYELRLRIVTTLIVFVFTARDYVIRMAQNLLTVLVG